MKTSEQQEPAMTTERELLRDATELLYDSASGFIEGSSHADQWNEQRDSFIENARAFLSRPAQEPVAIVTVHPDKPPHFDHYKRIFGLPAGDNYLYASPPPSPWISVKTRLPEEPTVTCKAVRAVKGGSHEPSEFRWCSSCGKLLKDNDPCAMLAAIPKEGT